MIKSEPKSLTCLKSPGCNLQPRLNPGNLTFKLYSCHSFRRSHQGPDIQDRKVQFSLKVPRPEPRLPVSPQSQDLCLTCSYCCCVSQPLARRPQAYAKKESQGQKGQRNPSQLLPAALAWNATTFPPLSPQVRGNPQGSGAASDQRTTLPVPILLQRAHVIFAEHKGDLSLHLLSFFNRVNDDKVPCRGRREKHSRSYLVGCRGHRKRFGLPKGCHLSPLLIQMFLRYLEGMLTRKRCPWAVSTPHTDCSLGSWGPGPGETKNQSASSVPTPAELYSTLSQPGL